MRFMNFIELFQREQFLFVTCLRQCRGSTALRTLSEECCATNIDLAFHRRPHPATAFIDLHCPSLSFIVLRCPSLTFVIVSPLLSKVEKCFEASTIGEHAKELEGKRAQLVDAVLGQPGDVNSH